MTKIEQFAIGTLISAMRFEALGLSASALVKRGKLEHPDMSIDEQSKDTDGDWFQVGYAEGRSEARESAINRLEELLRASMEDDERAARKR